MSVKAWRIVWAGILDETGICIAETRGKALALAMRQLEECGYRAVWSDLRCRRAPEYDAWARRQPAHRRPVVEEWVKREAERSVMG